MEEDLGPLGFLFEPFGPDAVRVNAAPESAADPEAAFLAALHALAGGEDLAKALACKGSTKFGGLSREGMAGLLDEWASCDFPNVYPHGLTIVKRVALADLLREFGRL